MDTAKKILAKLLDGLLPTHEPLKCWAGSGTGSVCNGCDAQIVSTDVEHELDFDNPPTVRLHAACDAIWRKTTSCRG